MSRGKWVIFKDIAGTYRFRLVAANGEIVAASEAYQTRSNARQGIDTVKLYASANLEIIDRTGDDKDKTRIVGAL